MINRAFIASISLSILILFLIGGGLHASDATIVVNGLFKNKAVLLINGKQHILSVGKTGPEGIKLTSITGDDVTLTINGKKHTYKLGDTSSISTNFKQSEEQEVTISLNQQGQFLTFGYINNQTVQFLVDTGATSVALNSIQAKKLGLDYRKKGVPSVVATASGMSKAYRITLDTVSVGEIRLHHIDAMVIEGNFPVHVLLGMSFLGSLDIHREGQLMKIKKKW